MPCGFPLRATADRSDFRAERRIDRGFRAAAITLADAVDEGESVGRRQTALVSRCGGLECAPFGVARSTQKPRPIGLDF